MSLVTELDALLREREARHRMRMRQEELEFRREVDRLGAIRARLVQVDDEAGAERAAWLSRAEIAAIPPRRSPAAVRRAIIRAKQKAPVETRMRGKEVTYPRSWLEENRICSPCAC